MFAVLIKSFKFPIINIFNFMKDILTKDEIESFFKTFSQSIQDLIICTENIQSIIKQNQQSYNVTTLINPFLFHYVALSYSYCTLTLSKLFIHQEKRSFFKFLNKLENSDYDDSLKQILRNNTLKSKNGFPNEYDYLLTNKIAIKAEISETKQLLLAAEILINKIKARRDSYYAHLDPDKVDSIEVESLEDINELLSLALKIFHVYLGGLMNTTFIFNVPEDMNNIFKLINEK